LLRVRRGPARVVAVRREIIRRAIAAGHRGVVIARYLNVSEATVSKIANEFYRARWALDDQTSRGSAGDSNGRK
jgi:transposase